MIRYNEDRNKYKNVVEACEGPVWTVNHRVPHAVNPVDEEYTFYEKRSYMERIYCHFSSSTSINMPLISNIYYVLPVLCTMVIFLW